MGGVTYPCGSYAGIRRGGRQSDPFGGPCPGHFRPPGGRASSFREGSTMAYGFRRSRALRLEVLGERALPSVTVIDDGAGVVTITGDQQANTIDITDNGSGGVKVVADE